MLSKFVRTYLFSFTSVRSCRGEVLKMNARSIHDSSRPIAADAEYVPLR